MDGVLIPRHRLRSDRRRYGLLLGAAIVAGLAAPQAVAQGCPDGTTIVDIDLDAQLRAPDSGEVIGLVMAGDRASEVLGFVKSCTGQTVTVYYKETETFVEIPREAIVLGESGRAPVNHGKAVEGVIGSEGVTDN